MIDLKGRKFGRLLVVEFAGGPYYSWLCKCKCGETKIVSGQSLREDRVKSCGCLRSEVMSKIKRSHGDYVNGQQTVEYRAWAQMLQRCTNENNPAYDDYGGRGITVCQRWRKYKNFLKDMGRKPTPDHQLDRKNNDKGYSPKNCRWATRKEQCNNRRTPRRAHLRGRKHGRP